MAPARWKETLWIVDGHNAIFAVGRLCRLQMEGKRQEARRRLELMLEPFARLLNRPLLLVFDGNELIPNPEAGERAGIRTLFSQPPEDADDRIVYLTEQARSRGEAVAVVTNDRRSLAPRLASGTGILAIEVFIDQHLQPLLPEPRKEDGLSRADRDEIAAAFLAREDEIRQDARRRARGRERDAVRRWRARVGRPEPREKAPEEETLRGREWREEEWWIPSPPAERDGPAEPASPARESPEGRAAREAKRKRGERKQQRRLAKMRERERKRRPR